MLERREFIKIFGMGAAVCLLFPDNIIPAEIYDENYPMKACQPRRILYGDRNSGCSCWNPSESFKIPSDIL